jgi:hypothetical protein
MIPASSESMGAAGSRKSDDEGSGVVPGQGRGPDGFSEAITEMRRKRIDELAYDFVRFRRTARVRTMFALHRQTRSLAARFVFGLAAVFLLALACGLASHTATAQVRFGIGIGGGIGGVLLDDAYRRQKSQQSEQYQRSQSGRESSSTKKTAKAKNQKPKRGDSKVAKDSPPKAKPPDRRRPTILGNDFITDLSMF